MTLNKLNAIVSKLMASRNTDNVAFAIELGNTELCEISDAWDGVQDQLLNEEITDFVNKIKS